MRTDRLLVLGLTCAGKTTFGNFLRRRYGFVHIEASDIIRQKRGTADGPTLSLEEIFTSFGRNIVPEAVLKRLGPDPALEFVVTGIRLQEELIALSQLYDPLVLWIEASQRTRLQRYLRRRRPGAVRTERDFRAVEEAQEKLLTVSSSDAHLVVENDGTLEEYWARAEADLLLKRSSLD
jgi:dephospho-CoA kinase